MLSDATLRRATPLDFETIENLCVEAYQEYQQFVGPAGWEAMRGGLSQACRTQPAARWAVVEQDGQIQACVAYFAPQVAPFKYFPAEWAYLRFLGVRPKARGKGFARPLMAWCIEQALGDGAEFLGLHTSQQAGHGYRLYEKMGFQEDGDLPDFRGLPYVRYVLKLQA